MAIQTTKPANPLKQHGKEQDGACPVSSNNFWFLLCSVLACPNLPPPTLFRRPNSSPKNIFGGPKNVTKFLRDRRESKNMQNRGPENTFSGRTKNSPQNGNFAAEARGQNSRKRHCLVTHVKLYFKGQWELFSWMQTRMPMWRMCHLPPKSTGRAKSIRSGTCIRCSGIRVYGDMDEKKRGWPKIASPSTCRSHTPIDALLRKMAEELLPKSCDDGLQCEISAWF